MSSERIRRLSADLQAHRGVKSSFPFGDTYHVTLSAGTSPEQLKSYLENQGHSSVEIRTIRPTVEDCFMLLAKNNGNEK